ncbi:NADPH dependend quinone reductase (plasmid) [Cupriavidus necator N-1]|uniref:NADPH dependend quinone reductase n=1 Tax=Cupriavidus necator (strain ATCC 43291 / DSM 13513 / CCUG 52238 / LMG 8453 / N-1) TaxID=1042878 RepID=F8GYX3_CUPNN|nr:zinc-binding dehydrogenase [Cupriavidus necator]AEI83064.1 NADPH dependend quinone reductase [Cupriavidus necator N-1]MDX6008475.1 zinc-binding dehydrogenase [Cupriavidus necator]
MKGAVSLSGRLPAYQEFREPEAAGGQVVVDVSAAALTRLDMAIAEGRHYIKPPVEQFIVGREGVGRLADGRRIYFNVNAPAAPFGSMAQRALVDAELTFPVPDGIDDARAAALGNAGLAAWLPLSWRARMLAGETVLILGATGISGLLAVASAKLLGAGRVIAAGRDTQALERARRLGADAVVVLDSGTDLPAAYRKAAQGEVDVVLDYLCGSPAEAALQVLGHGGRLVHIGTTVGPTITFAGAAARKACFDIMGFAYYHAPIAEQARAYAELCRHTETGRMEIDIEPTPLSEIAQAWQAQARGARQRFVLVP